MAIFHWKVEQGTAEWYALRSGRPTASEFDKIMTPKTMKPSEQRKDYACRLIAQRLMNWQPDSLDKIDHIADGKANEPLAVARLEMVFDVKSEPVGFVQTNDGRFGASPDRVGEVSSARDKAGIVVEVKSPTIPVQMRRLLYGDDLAYRCQRQGQLWVAEADKAIFFSSNQRMPDYIVEDGRDEGFIRALTDCLERFSDELEELTLKARSLGAFERYAQIAPPLDAELGPKLTEEVMKDIGIPYVDDWDNDA